MLCGLLAGAGYPAAAQTVAANDEPALIDPSLVTAADYPLASRWRGEMGRVEVKMSVSADGRPSSCEVTTPSPFDRLNKRTCEIFLARARYDLSGRKQDTKDRIVANQAVDWQLEASEPRPLLFDVKLVSETSVEGGGRYCRFSDGTGVRVSAKDPCVRKLGTDEVRTEAADKPTTYTILDHYRSGAGDEAATAMAMLLLRFSYAQWQGEMARAADLGSASAAAVLCNVDDEMLETPIGLHDRLHFCRTAVDGGVPGAPEILVRDVFERRTEDRQLALRTLGRLFPYSVLARRHMGEMLIEERRFDEAAAYLALAVKDGDKASAAVLASLFRMTGNPHADAAAAQVWSRVAEGATALQIKADMTLSAEARKAALVCVDNLQECDAGFSGEMKALVQQVLASHSFAQPEILTNAQVSSADYSKSARRQNISGMTQLFYRVDASGTVDRCYVLQSALLPSLDDKACEVVRRRTFGPARMGAEPQAGWKTQDIRWALKGDVLQSVGMALIGGLLLGLVP
jgi:TonB family protein